MTRRPAVTAVLATCAVLATVVATAPAAVADPASPPGGIEPPARTSISLSTPLGEFGSPNRTEARPALSEIKLFMADWVLNRGDGSARDRWLCERMIRASDDAAAQELWAKYGPVSIFSPAAHYGLHHTRAGAAWGTSRTSAVDITRFLDAKRIGDPGSPILEWMRQSDPVAADGTHQDWGTDRFSGVEGTKWGWSDHGPRIVASASFGRAFSIAAVTYGTPADQDADLAWSVADVPAPPPVLGSVTLPPAAAPAPAPAPITLPAPFDGSAAAVPALPAPPVFTPPVLSTPGFTPPDLLGDAARALGTALPSGSLG